MWLFFYVNFERSYDILKAKSPCILLNKNKNFNKNEMESKMENPTYSFRETILVLQLTQKSQLKSKTVMSWSSQKKGYFLYNLFCLNELFLTFVIYLNAQCTQYTFRILFTYLFMNLL